MALYFTNPTKGTLPLMMSGELGFIDTPRQGNRRPIGVTWCADNGCFSDKFNEKDWWRWLKNQTADADMCAFAVAPDVVGDYKATYWLSPMNSPYGELDTDNTKAAIEYCLAHPQWRLNIQTHKVIGMP